MTYFSHSAYYMFHLTSLVLLLLITMEYYSNHFKNKIITSRLVTYSFSIITLSQIVFIFVNLNPLIYVIAECVQLIGYAILLLAFIMVLKYGKKKK